MKLTFQSVSLFVADVERSVAFYMKLPGAETVIHRTGQFAKIQFGQACVQLVGMPDEQGFHIEMNCENLQKLYEELTKSGLEPDGPPTQQFFGRTQFEIHDPDGHTIEFDTPS